MTTPAAAPLDARKHEALRVAAAIQAYQASAAIGALARLGVADALAAGSLAPADLAARVAADEASLARLLAATLELGLFVCEPDGRWRATEAGALLRSDAEGSLRRLAIVSTDEWRWRAYGHLTHAVRTGEPGLVPAHGVGFWAYLEAHPEAAASFDESMARIAAARDTALLRAYDFGAARRVVDVGGGRGSLVRAALTAHPSLRAVLFERPTALEGARAALEAAGLGERLELVAGDFFADVPPGVDEGDRYVLSWILHDWSDADAARVLATTRRAMRPGARLLVVELVVPEPGDPAASAAARLVAKTDLEMLAVVGGRERTAAEYARLLGAAGFQLARVSPLPGLPWSVVEAELANARTSAL